MILCEPLSRSSFDSLAGTFAPGFTSLQYHSGSIGLEKGPDVRAPRWGSGYPADERFVASRSNRCQNRRACLGLKVCTCFLMASENYLYVGEARILRLRLKKRLEHSDSRGLARWMSNQGTDTLILEIQEYYEEGTLTSVRRALELELIRSRAPIFNIQR